LQYEKLDEEHKCLFKGVFAVAEKPGDAGALSNLVCVVKSHFATEEVSTSMHCIPLLTRTSLQSLPTAFCDR